jgi:hypothetical protein
MVLFKFWATLDFSIVLYLGLDHLFQITQLEWYMVHVVLFSNPSAIMESFVAWTHDNLVDFSSYCTQGFIIFNFYAAYTMCFFRYLVSWNHTVWVWDAPTGRENMEYGMPSISIGYGLCRERNNFYIHVDWRRYIYGLILYCFTSLFCLQSKVPTYSLTIFYTIKIIFWLASNYRTERVSGLGTYNYLWTNRSQCDYVDIVC